MCALQSTSPSRHKRYVRDSVAVIVSRAKKNNWATRITEFAIAPFGGLPGVSGRFCIVDFFFLNTRLN